MNGFHVARMRRRWWLWGPTVYEWLGVPADGPFDDPASPIDVLEWLPKETQAWTFGWENAVRHANLQSALGDTDVVVTVARDPSETGGPPAIAWPLEPG